MKYLIGLDNGGTSVKSVVFDIEGREIASASCQIATISPQSFYVERDMDEVWDKNKEVIRKSIEKAGIASSDILGLGLSGHGKGIYLLGEDDSYVYNSILSSDSRADYIVKRWQEEGLDQCFHANYQNPFASQLPALLKWLDENTQVLEETKYIFGIKDFISYKLTGQAYNEITDLSGSGLIDFAHRTLDVSLLNQLGLGAYIDKFPELIEPSQLVGRVGKEVSSQTGLPLGCPVAAGMFDIDACAIAMNIVDSNHLALIGGTWSINGFISKEPLFTKSTTQNSIYCLDGYYFIEESSPTSASNNEWFINNLFEGKDKKTSYDLVNSLVESETIDLEGPIYCPYLYGSNYNRRAKAGLVDLNSSNNLASVFRSIYEGIAFAHKEHLDKLLELKDDFKSVRIAGGVINSPIWLQIFADVLDMEIEVINQKELGAFGAMMAAGVAVGQYEDLRQVAKTLVKVEKVIRPIEENVKIYRKKYERYREVADFLTE